MKPNKLNFYLYADVKFGGNDRDYQYYFFQPQIIILITKRVSSLIETSIAREKKIIFIHSVNTRTETIERAVSIHWSLAWIRFIIDHFRL